MISERWVYVMNMNFIHVILRTYLIVLLLIERHSLSTRFRDAVVLLVILNTKAAWPGSLTYGTSQAQP